MAEEDFRQTALDSDEDDEFDGGDVYFSDLSDYFDEDAHLLDNSLGVKVHELSLDEVSYERDINKVNTAHSQNQKRNRSRINPADLAKLHDVPTRDPKDPTYVRPRDRRKEGRKERKERDKDKDKERPRSERRGRGASGEPREERRKPKEIKEPVLLQRAMREATRDADNSSRKAAGSAAFPDGIEPGMAPGGTGTADPSSTSAVNAHHQRNFDSRDRDRGSRRSRRGQNQHGPPQSDLPIPSAVDYVDVFASNGGHMISSGKGNSTHVDKGFPGSEQGPADVNFEAFNTSEYLPVPPHQLQYHRERGGGRHAQYQHRFQGQQGPQWQGQGQGQEQGAYGQGHGQGNGPRNSRVNRPAPSEYQHGYGQGQGHGQQFSGDAMYRPRHHQRSQHGHGYDQQSYYDYEGDYYPTNQTQQAAYGASFPRGESHQSTTTASAPLAALATPVVSDPAAAGQTKLRASAREFVPSFA